MSLIRPLPVISTPLAGASRCLSCLSSMDSFGSSYTPPSGPPGRPRDSPPPRPPQPPAHSTDIAALQSTIDSLQAELSATNRVNTHLACTVACLQAEQASPTPTTTSAMSPAPPITTATTATTITTSAQIPCSHPDHPGTIASGRGAASPEVFQQIIKANWHGRLGRTHMVEVDNLPASALTELDCFLRRKLHTVFPRGGAYAEPDADKIFASLAALGLRLEDRGAYADLPVLRDDTIRNEATLKRAKNFALCYYAHDVCSEYWRGSVLETMAELARYRGLFDENDFLKRE